MSWQLDNFLRPQGAFPPGFYLLREGWVNRPAPEAPLIRGMPTGPLAFLKMPGACGLRPCARTHHKKGLVPHLPVGCGWATNTANTAISDAARAVAVTLRFSSCWVALRPAVLAAARIWPSVSWQLDNFLPPQGAFPPGFYSLRGGWVNRPAPEAPLIRRMPTGP